MNICKGLGKGKAGHSHFLAPVTLSLTTTLMAVVPAGNSTPGGGAAALTK